MTGWTIKLGPFSIAVAVAWVPALKRAAREAAQEDEKAKD